MSEKKLNYFKTLQGLASEYPKIIIVNADNVGSNHMQKIRKALRGMAVLLMGKNTLMRKAIRDNLSEAPQLEALLPYIKGNIGLVFTKQDLALVRNAVVDLKVAAPAKVGTISPSNVIVPKGNTGLEPTKTSFLQALNIQSKINKGQIEIINDVSLIKEGERIGSSEATLLQLLNIKPFFYGLKVLSIYDNGSVYGTNVLEITEADVISRLSEGISVVTCISLGLSYPCLSAFPHVVMNGFKNLLAIALATEYSFPQADKIKFAMSNPGSSVASNTPTISNNANNNSTVADVVVEEDEEPSDDEPVNLFGDDW